MPPIFNLRDWGWGVRGEGERALRPLPPPPGALAARLRPAALALSCKKCYLFSTLPENTDIILYARPVQFSHVVHARRRPAPGHPQAVGRGAGRASPPGFIRGHRVRQDLYHRQRRGPDSTCPPWSWPPTRPWRPSSTASSRSSFRTTRWSISSATTIIISRRPTSPRPTSTSRKTPPSTKPLTGCATPPRAPCSTART